jgi:hypothetical protein
VTTARSDDDPRPHSVASAASPRRVISRAEDVRRADGEVRRLGAGDFASMLRSLPLLLSRNDVTPDSPFVIAMVARRIRELYPRGGREREREQRWLIEIASDADLARVLSCCSIVDVMADGALEGSPIFRRRVVGGSFSRSRSSSAASDIQTRSSDSLRGTEPIRKRYVPGYVARPSSKH